MVLYGVENHYSLPGDSDVTKLFHTEQEAMVYLMQKFEENADENGYVCERIQWHDEQDVVTYSEAKAHKGFYYDNGEAIDHYRIVKYEI